MVKNSTLHEHDNQHNRFAVAILEEGTDSHLPCEISQLWVLENGQNNWYESNW